MLVRLSVAPEAIPETLGMRPAWMGRQSIAVHYAHTFAHLFTPGAVSSCQFFSRHVFCEETQETHADTELPELKIGLGIVEL